MAQQATRIDLQQLQANGRVLRGNLFKPYYDQVRQRLRELGADAYDMTVPESNIVPLIVHPSEDILGVVYGRYQQDTSTGAVVGRGILVATSRCMYLIDRKPLFLRCNEISYDVISAISYTKVWPAEMIVLHSRLGNINIRTFNQACADNFIEAVEHSILPDGYVPHRLPV